MLHKLRIFLTTILLIPATLLAQQQFITQGKIEYERKTNQFAFMDESNIFDDLEKNFFSKFITYYYDLTFKGGNLLYKQGREADTKQNKYLSVLPSENTIRTNLDSNSMVVQRNIFGDLYLISDSMRNVEWRITPVIRKIAGFDCRKAVGKIMDSIVVIAFYTDEVMTTGGPETFGGLPGMILGLAIPRLHTTWYATKLQLIEVTDKDLAAPKKGKKMTGSEYSTQVKDIMKDWGEESKKWQWQFFM